MDRRRGEVSSSAIVHHADWRTLATSGLVAPGSIDMLYVDPPFNTGATKRGTARAASSRRPAAYADRWTSMDAYIAWLRECITPTLALLRPSASVLIHCDWRASHHVRLLLDECLGPTNFVNHLIWSYGLGGSSPRMFARKHDDILLYAVRDRERYFHPPRVPATSRRMAGQTKKATDVLAIASLNNMSSERTGYPTQKPLALLELLIHACCPPGGVVLDPCCGSGTTAVAAVRLGRRTIAGDRSAAAIRMTRLRLRALGVGVASG